MPKQEPNDVYRSMKLAALVSLLLVAPIATGRAASLVDVVRDVRPKMVKIYGAGGLRGLEAYQSGMLISAQGHVLTAWSYVLDVDVTVVLDDGRRLSAELLGADPLSEVAVLKVDALGEPLPYFEMAPFATADVGDRVLAFCNLFGIATGNEPVSVLHGHLAAVAPLEARRGSYRSNYRGEVYVVDAATNNPGAAGGALTDQQGRLLGMLGKELRSELTETWLNYALPTEAFAPAVEAIVAGRYTPPELAAADRPERPLSLAALGVVLVPDVVVRTPPYVDRVLPDSPAAKAGLRPDDLVVMFDIHVVTSIQQVDRLLERYDDDAKLRVTIFRDGQLVEFNLQASTMTERPVEE
jgi:serine protease Do